MNLDTKLSRHIEEALNKGATSEELLEHFKVKKQFLKNKDVPSNPKRFFWITSLLFVLYALSHPQVYQSPREFIEDIKDNYLVSSTDKCLVGMTATSLELTRPVSNCNICREISEVFLIILFYFILLYPVICF